MFDSEQKLYAELWEQDWQAKCKREEMEAALQIERNAEMLKASTKGYSVDSLTPPLIK